MTLLTSLDDVVDVMTADAEQRSDACKVFIERLHK